MPFTCFNCGGECGIEDQHCPHCGYHVAEHYYRDQMKMLEDAIGGWRSEAEKKDARLARVPGLVLDIYLLGRKNADSEEWKRSEEYKLLEAWEAKE